MIDTLSLAAMHIALALVLLQFMRRDDPEDPPRRARTRFDPKRPRRD